MTTIMNKQNPSDKHISIEQELLSYSVEQMTELKRRTEAFGIEVFNKALELFGTNPKHFNANPKALQLMLSKFIKDKIQGTFSTDEMITEFAIQRACITLSMMKKYADDQKRRN